MKHHKTKLVLTAQTIRTLTSVQLTRAQGGAGNPGVDIITESDVCGPSDASSCPTHEWSCVNMSCTLQAGGA